MNHPAHLLGPFVFAAVILTGGCTQGEVSVQQRRDSTASSTIPASAPSRVDIADEPSPVLQYQAGPRPDTVPTPDRSRWRPKMPMVRVGSCPGEDCTYGNLVVACVDLPLFAADSLGAKQSGVTIRKGDTVTLVTGNLHLTEPGIVLIKRDYEITEYSNSEGGPRQPRPDTLRFFAGDTVYVLDYLELGDWNWWYRGNAGASEEFWTGVLQRSYGPGDDQRPAISVSKTRGEWWYKLQVNQQDEGGWVRGGRGRYVDRKFIGLDSDWKCGSDPGNSRYSDLDPPA